MNTIIQTVPDLVSDHLKDAAAQFGLENSESVYRQLEKSWTEKMHVFEEKMEEMGMEEAGDFDPLDERAALFLTYSGSLLSLSSLENGVREIRYTSIGLRKDVPGSLLIEHSNIDEIAENGKSLVFKEGPIKKTSPLYKIVVPQGNLNKDDQTCLIEDAATVITEKFAEMNQELL